MPPTLQLVRAIAADIPFIVATECLPGYEEVVGRWDEDYHRRALTDPRYVYFIVREGTDPVGFSIVRDWESPEQVALIKRVAVRDPGRGYVKALLHALLDTIFRETSTYRVWLGVFPDNIRARRAYQAVGFREEGIARGSAFFGGVHRDELIMSLVRPEWAARRQASRSMPRLQFWYEFASTYSYLSAMRIEDLAKAARVEVLWRPFLLAPLFKAQGWNTSPFNLYPIKGRYMIRDMQRLTEERGLPFVLPEPFPQNSLLAARVAFLGESEGWTAPFTKAVYQAEFGQGADISASSTLVDILGQLGIDADRVTSGASGARVKEGLRQRTAEAQSFAIFGAPSFITDDGELFWGDDRLEQALAGAKRT